MALVDRCPSTVSAKRMSASRSRTGQFRPNCAPSPRLNLKAGFSLKSKIYTHITYAKQNAKPSVLNATRARPVIALRCATRPVRALLRARRGRKVRGLQARPAPNAHG